MAIAIVLGRDEWYLLDWPAVAVRIDLNKSSR
jgi:hypothetical protein